MGIPLILGYSEGFERSGDSFRAKCPCCGQDAKMFHGKTNESVRAFFISLWDGGVPAVQCGECLKVFEEPAEEKPKRSSAPPPRSAPRPAITEKAIDDELARLKKKLGK